MTRNVLIIGSLGAALLLSACNDSSSSPPPPAAPAPEAPGGVNPPPPGPTGPTDPVDPGPTTSAPAGAQGDWRGSINSPTPGSRLVETIVLDDGTLWMAYSTASDPTQTDALLNAAGLIKGQGTPDEATGTYVVSGRQLSLEDHARARVQVDATFVTGSTLGGSIRRDTVQGQGQGTLPNPSDFSTLYRTAYNTNLRLQDLAGSYQGSLSTSLGKSSASADISAAGEVSGVNNDGCSFSGSATPRSRGNVFDLALTFGSEAGCGTNAATPVTGVVSLEAGHAGMLATDTDMKKAFIFSGNR